MKSLYKHTDSLDKRLVSKFLLSEEILMENAANSLAELIKSITHKQSVILIVCGSGDNGGDGYALARKLHKDYKVRIYQAKEPKSKLCRIQSERAMACGIEYAKRILPCDVIVDCLFGSGFQGELQSEFITLIETMNTHSRIRIACDMPSGLDLEGNIEKIAFKAHYTMAMGAIKIALLSDSAKDVVGEIVVGNLGVSQENFEIHTSFFMLEANDLKLPFRESKNCHKGDFGHISIVSGEKKGASILSALAALRIGTGLVSVVGEIEGYPEIMSVARIPKKANVVAIGMGLGKVDFDLIEMLEDKIAIIDADLFYEPQLKALLDSRKKQSNLILTPHPKEFVSLLDICALGGLIKPDIDDVLKDRLEYVSLFSEAYPNTTLLLKGANSIIAHQGRIYINPLGSSALAKGGSGDVLSGIIGGYVAQGFSTLDSTIYGSLAHAISAHKEPNSYALTPLRLIDHLGTLTQ